MKRLLIATGTAALLALSAPAATQLGVGSVNVASGATVSMPLTLQSDQPVTALQVDLVASPAVVDFRVPASDGILASHGADGNIVAPGVYRVMIYSLFNHPLQNGTVLTLNGTVSPLFESGSVSLVLSNAILSSPVGQVVNNVSLGTGTMRVGTVGTVQLAAVTVSPGGILQFSISGLSGATYVIESSNDLAAWITISTQPVTGSTATFSRAVPAGQLRQFYRVRLP